jgi:DNA repair/transcription protein MET18/MMS19
VLWVDYTRRLFNGPMQRALEADSTSLICDPVILEDLGRLLTITLRQVDTSEHQKMSSEIYSTIVPERISSPRDSRVDQNGCSTIFLTYLLAGLHPSVKLPLPTSELLTTSAVESRNSTIAASIEALNLQSALLVNKWFSVKDEALITPITDELFAGIKATSTDPRQARQSIISLLHVTKGLGLRLDPAAFRLLDRLVPLISDPTHGTTVAQSFALLLSPSSLLTKANFCLVRLLYAQRFFIYVLPSLSAAFTPNTAPPIKTNHLIALAGLLPHVPSSAILPEAATLIPLLLQGIDSSDAKVKAVSISTLQILCVEKFSPVEEHMGSVVSRLLRAAKKNGESGKDSNPPGVRLASLRCLRGFPVEFRREVLLPYKKAVVKGLTDALDDGKRAVRKEAVECRRTWLELDEADDD